MRVPAFLTNPRTGGGRVRHLLGAAIPAISPPPPRQEGRSRLARRFSAFVAVAMVAAGFAVAHHTPPASAQTTNVIWSATLTVGTDVQGAGTYGCHEFADVTADECPALLTPITFTYSGSTYTVAVLLVNTGLSGGQFAFDMASSLTSQQYEDFAPLVLRVDGHAYRFAAASQSGNGWAWNKSGTNTDVGPLTTSLSTKSTVVVELLEITYGTGTSVTDWEGELWSKGLGDGTFGCRNGVDGAGCGDGSVLSDGRFKHPGGNNYISYSVQELSFEQLAVYARETRYRVVFTVESDWTVDLKPMTLVLSVGGSEYRLPFNSARRSNNGRTFTWLTSIESLSHDWGHRTTYDRVKMRIDAVRTGLNPIRVYYGGLRDNVPFTPPGGVQVLVDGVATDSNDGSNFSRWDIARAKPYDNAAGRAYIAVIPGEFTSIDPSIGKVTTTHAQLQLSGSWPGSEISYAKGAWDAPPNQSAFQSTFRRDRLSLPIELDAASKNTYVWVRVTNGDQTTTHLVIIDPPPRTYKVNPEVQVTEGEEAAVTVSLGSPATRGGVTFDVTAAYGDGGATADDIGEIVSTVTVPEGERSVRIAVPTVDDDAVEDDESFTVSVSHVGSPAWAEDPQGTATSTITIANDDEPPPGPEPWNIQVTPGDGTLTVTWNVSSRDGYDDAEIWHALRWFQPYGGPHRWDNPRDRRAVGRNDGLSVDPGVNSYTITGLTNGVATDVFVRSMVGHRNNMSERLRDSSKWVKATGDTTPVAPPNEAPTVAYGIADMTITSENGTGEVSLSGVFADADGDDLTVTAVSSDENVAAVSVPADYATLTVNANTRGTATVTVTADDGSGGSVQDSFTVTVKAAPAVASAIADVGELQIDAAHEVPLSGVFSDPDGDALTISATSSDNAIATVSATIDPVTGSTTALTVTATGEGTATVTVTARDSDGNSVSDDFDVTVPAPEVQPLQEAQPLLQQAATLPGAVTGLTLTATGNSVTVSWTAPTDGAVPTRYIVHLKPDGGEHGSGKTKRPKAPKTQVKFKNLELGTTYLVWVRARNETGKGERTHATITLPTPQPQ